MITAKKALANSENSEIHNKLWKQFSKGIEEASIQGERKYMVSGYSKDRPALSRLQTKLEELGYRCSWYDFQASDALYFTVEW